MNFFFSASELEELRADAESRYGAANGGSDAIVRRKDPANPVIVDGLKVPGWTVTHASLAGRFAGAARGGAGTRTVTIGQTEVQVALREWHCAAATTNLHEGDLIEITAGDNTGVVVQIVEATWQDQATARRLPVIEIKRPAEWA